MHLIALLGLFQTEMTVFLTFLYTSTSEISAGPKTFFRPFGLHFGPKIREGGGRQAPPLNPPLEIPTLSYT